MRRVFRIILVPFTWVAATAQGQLWPPVIDERRIVTVRAIPVAAGSRTVEVGSMEELARIAEFEDAMILVRQERGVSEYAVAGVGALYVFRQVVGTHREWAAA